MADQEGKEGAREARFYFDDGEQRIGYIGGGIPSRLYASRPLTIQPPAPDIESPDLYIEQALFKLAGLVDGVAIYVEEGARTLQKREE